METLAGAEAEETLAEAEAMETLAEAEAEEALAEAEAGSSFRVQPPQHKHVICAVYGYKQTEVTSLTIQSIRGVRFIV